MIPYLAQYSIRSKQNYIFRTDRLREVTGASALIAGAFDRLLRCAEDIGLKVSSADPERDFSLADTLDAFRKGELQIAELFQGGGNDTLLMDSEETFRRLNEVYTRDLMVNAPGMVPLCVGIPAGEGWNYDEDYKKLSRAVSAAKNTMSPGQPADGLPFAMLDSVTRKPFVSGKPARSRPGARYTAERLAKQIAYEAGRGQDEAVSQLDDLLGKEDSMLAIVHADGNNMGKKLSGLLAGRTDYDFCVNALRRFSREIDRIFIEEGDKALQEEKKAIISENPTLQGKFLEARTVISDGDDYTFICNAKYALRLTDAYLRSVAVHEGYSSCAGICVFHRHYPFARAYDLAEQACENAKKKVHTEARPDQCWLDFHYLHGGVPDDLEETRRDQGTDRCMLRPWRCDTQEDATSLRRLIALKDCMVSASGEAGKTTRTNLKTLGAAIEISREEALGELKRIYFRAPGLEKQLAALFPEEDRLLRAIYDLSEVYDLWFEGGRNHG